jgi:hypothetical protein|tara:strand:+ start:295 stop:573 length:279 start_codon:yes stop_codon:yes gene_type:complete
MENITEQKYLELCDEFKDVIREKDRQLKSASVKALVLGKIVAESYGVIKIIDNTLDNLESNLDSVVMIKKLVETLRTDLSNTVESMIEDDYE